MAWRRNGAGGAGGGRRRQREGEGRRRRRRQGGGAVHCGDARGLGCVLARAGRAWPCRGTAARSGAGRGGDLGEIRDGLATG
ncbi:hypothetical protein ABZP36_003525 [Zizania latifolia]